MLKKALLAALLTLLCPAVCCAAIFTLKDGRQVPGDVVDEDAQAVYLRTADTDLINESYKSKGLQDSAGRKIICVGSFLSAFSGGQNQPQLVDPPSAGIFPLLGDFMIQYNPPRNWKAMKFEGSDNFAFFLSPGNKKSILNIVFLSPGQLDYVIFYAHYRKTSEEAWFEEARQALKAESPDADYALKNTSFQGAKALQASMDWAKKIYFVRNGFPFEISYGSYGGRNMEKISETLKSFKVIFSQGGPDGQGRQEGD